MAEIGIKKRDGRTPRPQQHIRPERWGMAEYGEWNRKGATLSDVTAKKEYGVSRDFIVKGIRAGKLEYREGVMWGNPYLRVLRSQLEQYIAEELGRDRLSSGKNQTELRKINKEMAALKRRLSELQARRTELEKALKMLPTEHGAAPDALRPARAGLRVPARR